MIKLYIKTTMRQLRKFSSLSAINILSFVVAFTCILLLTVWINHELQYDRFYNEANRIYKVFLEEEVNGNLSKHPWVSFPLSKALREEVPEIKNSTIVKGGAIKVRYNDLIFYENKTCFTEANVFDIFGLDFIRGDKTNALKSKESIVITEKIAKKYFGNENAIGKILHINDDYQFQVTAVIKDIPDNSSINFDLFILAEYFSDPLTFNNTHWGALNFNSYIWLNKNANPDVVRDKIKGIAIKHNPDYKRYVNIQPIKQSHFYSVAGEPTNIKNIRIIILLGIIICLISLFNFLNISLGQYHKRITEFKTKEILGSNTKQITAQILFECFILILISTILSFFLSFFLFPLANKITGLNYSTNLLFKSFTLLPVSAYFIVSLIVSNIPLVFFSKSRLKSTVSSQVLVSKSKLNYRSIFVTFQFAASIILVIGSIVVARQLNYIIKKDMGLNTSNVITLPLNGSDRDKYPVLKTELLKNSHVKHVTAAYNWPTQINTSCGIEAWPGNNYQDRLELKYTVVDEDYFSTMGMTMVQGVPFSKKLKSDSVAYILNESAVKAMNLENPVGAMIDFGCWTTGKVIGVVKDFHLESMHTKIRPLLIAHHLWGAQHLLVKFNNKPDKVALSQVESIWKQINPQSPFSYQLLDHTTQNMYWKESRFKNLMISCCIIALILSTIGIFGIVLMQAQKRTKEIGVRKINGARITDILAMLNKESTKWILTSFTIACPIAWFIMNKWLENFAYKTELSWWIFALAGAVTLIIALFTVSWQSWKAATRNPVESLRYE